MTDKERIAKLEGYISRLLDQHDDIQHLFSMSIALAQKSAQNCIELENRITELEQNQPWNKKALQKLNEQTNLLIANEKPDSKAQGRS